MKMKSSILAGIASLFLLMPSSDKSLKNIAKLHLGVYECVEATLGSKDLLPAFSFLRLEFIDAENFLLHYQEKVGERKKVEGKYAYDSARGLLMLTDTERGIKGQFPLNEGKLILSMPLCGKQLVMQFQQK